MDIKHEKKMIGLFVRDARMKWRWMLKELDAQGQAFGEGLVRADAGLFADAGRLLEAGGRGGYAGGPGAQGEDRGMTKRGIIRLEISAIVSQMRNPVTDNPERERAELGAELVYWWGEERKQQEDWKAVR